MEAQVAPLHAMLKVNTRLFVNALEGVDDEAARMRPSGETNNAAFVALHVLDARAYLARYLGLEYQHPFGGLEGVSAIEDMADYPTLEDILGAWREVSDLLEQRLPTLSTDELEKESSQPFPIDDGRVVGGLAFLLLHESFHIGQLALLRKYLGLSSMSYS